MRKTKTIMLSFLLYGIGSLCLSAQEHPASSGADATGAGGSVSYTIGQLDYTNNTGVGGTITQGVQQPFEIYTVSVINQQNVDLSATLFPNPTTDYIVLTINNSNLNNLSYSLLDDQGKMIAQQNIMNFTANIDMATLRVGIYLLTINNQQGNLKSFKIIKN